MHSSEPTPFPASTSPSQARPEVAQDAESEAWESMSEVSDSPDVGDVHYADNARLPLTREDATLARIDALKVLLHAHPLVPRDPRNPTEPLLDMASGVRLPDLHCAFQGCHECWDFSVAGISTNGYLHWGPEWLLFLHLMRKHADAFAPELEAYGMHSTPLGLPTNLPEECPREYHTAQSKLQCDFFS